MDNPDKLSPAEVDRVSAAMAISKEQIEAGTPKKDATAARQLPELYAKLAEATALLDRTKAAGDEHLNVHTVSLNIAGDEATHLPHDKKAWGALFVKDLEAAVAAAKAKISALGFDPG